MSTSGRPYLIDACFILSSLLAIAGFLELASGPYLGLRISQDRSSPPIVLGVERDSPAAEALKLFPELVGARPLSIGNVALKYENLIEDPDYLGDRASIALFIADQERLWKALSNPGGADLMFLTAQGETRRLRIEQRRMGFVTALSRSGLMLFLGFFSICVGYIVACRRPADGNALRFFLMTFTVMLIFSSFGLYVARDIAFEPTMFKLLFLQNTLAFSAFFLSFPFFFMNFPRELRFLTTPAAKLGGAALAVLVFSLSVSRVFGSLSNTMFLAGLLIGIVSLLLRYAWAGSTTERYQIRWIFWGTLVFVLVFCATAIVPSLVIGRRLVSDRVPSLFFILIPLSILFAIERYHLMDIDQLIDSSLVYLLCLALFTAVDFAAFLAIRSLIPENAALSALISSLLACWAFILIYNTVRARLLAFVRFLFRRDVRDPLRLMERLSSRLSSISSVDPACAGFRAFLIEEFGARDAGLRLSISSDSGRRPRVVELGSVLPMPPAAMPRRPAFLHQLEGLAASRDIEDMVLVPVARAAAKEAAGHSIEGYALLGRKRANMLYSSAELSLLAALAAEFAERINACLANERAVAASEEAMREKERISRDIHDGLGSSLSLSLLLLDQIASPDPDGRLPELRRLVAGSLSDLRTLVWTMSDESSDSAALSDVIRSRLVPPLSALGFECSIVYSAAAVPRPLGSATRLHLYRVAQEFLANCAKYRKPGPISIALDEGEDSLACRFRCDSPASKGVVQADLSSGMGLGNIAGRAGELGATLVNRDQNDNSWGFDLLLPKAVTLHASGG